MIERSRTPESASCKVRGIGVAVSVRTCTSARSCLSFSLCVDAEMLLLVDDEQAEVPEPDGLAEQRMGADDDVDAAVGDALLRPAPARCRRRGARPGRSGSESRGSARRRSWCAGARASVVGTTTATCLPFMAVTKAARNATSVLPKPTSPQTRRSIGRPDAELVQHRRRSRPAGPRSPRRESRRRIRRRGRARRSSAALRATAARPRS